jgi:hypothetical protein
LKDGRLRADSVIDPGGHPLGDVFPSEAGLITTDQKPAAMEVNSSWIQALKTAQASGFVQAHAKGLYHYGGTNGTNIGNKIVLGTIGGIPVVIECVAGWGNNLSDTGIHPSDDPGKDNPNNFTLAFVISCGQFRYFIGGDMGGADEVQYVDQETSLSSRLTQKFPVAWSWNHNKQAAGHICGFKADHHGSDHSNNQTFMNEMTPAITVTSAGKQPGWHLPHPNYLNRLSHVTPLSVWTSATNQTFSRGIFVTNLYDFTNFPSKTTAIQLFNGHPDIAFSYGNSQPSGKSGYLIKVKPDGLNQKSQFQVYKMDNHGTSATLLANFFCHSI